jgi:YD repeat-containing protein
VDRVNVDDVIRAYTYDQSGNPLKIVDTRLHGPR